MSVRVPLREAADSMAKARTPEPFSSSRTSNWIAKVGGLPAYIQHIAHDLVEKRGKSVSNAIQMAIGIVRNWAEGKGNVDANTRAAARLAVKQFEEKRAKSKALRELDSTRPPAWEIRLAEEQVTATAIARLMVLKDRLGEAGIEQLLDGRALLEHENDSEDAVMVEAVGEMVRWDVLTAANRIPSLAELALEAVAPLAELFDPRELRDFRGRWERGHGSGHTVSMSALLTPSREPSSRVSVAPRSLAARTIPTATARRRTPNGSFARYEGGVVRSSARTRAQLESAPRLNVEDEAGLHRAIPEGDHTPGARRAADQVMGGTHEDTQHAHALRDHNGEIVRLPPAPGEKEGGVVYSPERTALHEKIISALLAGKTAPTGMRKPRAVFTAGGAASGKSALVKSGVVHVEGREPVGKLGHDNMVHVNPDIVRRMLPEYEMFAHAGREKEAANLTHEEASDIAKTVQRVAMGRQLHILVDGVGDSGPGKFAGKIRKAQEAGYDTSVTYATTPIDHAIERADHRGDETGRYVSHGTIIEGHQGVSARFPEVAAIPGVHVRVFDTSGPKGSGPPRLMYEHGARGQGESSAILDHVGMEAFRRKADINPDAELKRRGETWATMRAKR